MASRRRQDAMHEDHEQEPEITVWVRRDMRDWRKALYRLSDISGIRWDWVSGGLGFQAPGVFLYGYVPCDAYLEGELPHSGAHGGRCPHSIKVCILKKDNDPEVYHMLADFAGTKPEPPISCAERTVEYLREHGETLGPKLREYLSYHGHGRMTIGRVLPRLERKGLVKARRIGRAKAYRLPDQEETLPPRPVGLGSE